jgi:hypothetical protein
MTQEVPGKEQERTNHLDLQDEAGQDADILLTWKERNDVDDARVGAMYCFKSCDKNKN